MFASGAGEARSIVSKLLDNRDRINVTVKRQIWPWRPRNPVCSFFFTPELGKEALEDGAGNALASIMEDVKGQLLSHVGGKWTLDDSRQSVGGEYILTSDSSRPPSLRTFCERVKNSVKHLARQGFREKALVFNCASLRLGSFLPRSVPEKKVSKLKERLDDVIELPDGPVKEDEAALLAHALWSGSTGYERARISSMIRTVLTWDSARSAQREVESKPKE